MTDLHEATERLVNTYTEYQASEKDGYIGEPSGAILMRLDEAVLAARAALEAKEVPINEIAARNILATYLRPGDKPQSDYALHDLVTIVASRLEADKGVAWTKADDGAEGREYWGCTCGADFVFPECTPEDADTIYCPHCGGKIIEFKRPAESEDGEN